MDNKASGEYIFLSHNQSDIKAARVVRNYLESHEHNPILLYLHGMTDKEIPHIIEREIEARNWFVLCDSPAARKSKWVQFEREHVKKLSAHRYCEIDVTADFETVQKPVLDEFMRRMNVFVSCSHSDKPQVEQLISLLRKSEFTIFDDSTLTFGTEISTQIGAFIEKACEFGAILYFMSETSLNSKYVCREIDYAIIKGGRIIPIVIGDIVIPEEIDQLLALCEDRVEVSDHPTEHDAEMILQAIRTPKKNGLCNNNTATKRRKWFFGKKK